MRGSKARSGATSRGRFLRVLAIGCVTLSILSISFGQEEVLQQAAPARGDIAQVDVGAFLPAGAVLVKRLNLDVGHGSGTAVALAYGLEDEKDGPYIHCGVRILKKDVSGWAIAFEETDSVINGAGVSDAIVIEKVRSSRGAEGLLVVLKNSGAGTATDWHIVAKVGNKFLKLDSSRIRDRALKEKKYPFMGYNGVKSEGEFVIEDLPGYSPGRARCCPDRPTIEVRYRFTGSSVTLDAVKELPFTP